MEIQAIWSLRGPNFWSRRTCLEAWVDLGELADKPSNVLPGLYERLEAWLPGLIEHRCGIGERGGFLMRLREGTYAGHILEHVTIELQNLAGTRVGFGKARETSTPGLYKVAVRYRDERVARECLAAGKDLLLAAIDDRPFDVAGTIARLREFADGVLLGPTTAAIVDAAEARMIPVRRLTDASLVLLGQGSKQRRAWTAETDRTGAIGESIASDKELTKALLKECGLPVPEGRLVDSPADAWAAATEIGVPVVVKPRDGNHGRGVFTDLSAREDIEKAYPLARNEGSGVIVERYVPGHEHRLLVVGDRMVAAVKGDFAWVVGDGRHSILDLIELQLNSDPRRGATEDFPLNRVLIDDVALLDLSRQGFTPDAVPAAGVRVLVQRNGNQSIDVTDEVHPETADAMVLAARIVGLDIAGVDVVVQDVTRPLGEQRGAIVEVNAGPGIAIHLKPAAGKPRPVGEDIVRLLFPEGEDGRVPVVGITGTNGKTVVARLLSRMLQAGGLRVGTACTDGLMLDRRVVERGDRANLASAWKTLLNPQVDAAVLEAGSESILREGLGFDRCAVAVVTHIGEGDHLGSHFIHTPDDLVQVERCAVDVVLPSGTAVLNAGDPRVAEMASLSAGSVTFFAGDPALPVLGPHRAGGGRVVTVRAGCIVLDEGPAESPLVEVARLPLARGGAVPFQVENALAAVAAAWALGVTPDAMREVLQSFEADDAPGRFHVFEADGATVVVDDCRNPTAWAACAAALDGLPAVRRTGVFSAGAGRRDEDAIRLGEYLGASFDQVVLYDDPAVAEPSAVQLRTLVRRGLSSAGRATGIVEVGSFEEAAARELAALGPGGVLVLQAVESGVGSAVDLARAWAERRRQSVA